MTSLAALRSSSKSMLNKIQESNQSNSSGGGRYAADERIWKPTFDAERGTGTATIRFLPSCEAELNEIPYIKVHSHAFRGATGKLYMEKSLSTIGKPDPVGLLNSRLWNSGVESDKEVARKQKRKTTYFANVLVIKDPAHPELEGKVMIYEYGAKIAKMLQEAAFPTAEFEGEDAPEPLNAFDIDNGADFVIRMVGQSMAGSDGKTITVPNYDKSSFKARAPLHNGDDAKIEETWAKCHALKPLIAADKFKAFDALSARLVEVLGPLSGSGVPTVEGTVHEVEADDAPVKEQAKPAARTRKPAADKAPAAPVAQVDTGDDDDFAFLREVDGE